MSKVVFEDFKVISKAVQGRTLWFVEGHIDGARYEFATQTDEGAAATLARRLNLCIHHVIKAAGR